MRPESVDDISFCMCRIMPKVRIPSLWAFADFVARYRRRTFNLEVKLNIRTEGGSSTDVI